MDIKELVEAVINANEECIKYDEIDKKLYEEQMNLIREYEGENNSGLGNQDDFRKRMVEIQKKAQNNDRLYEKARANYRKVNDELMKAIVTDTNE